jgi:hypothetical protein
MSIASLIASFDEDLKLYYTYEIDEVGRATIFLDGKPEASCIGEEEVRTYLQETYNDYMKGIRW